MPLGYADLKNTLYLPGTWDLEYLRRFNGQAEGGVQFDDLAREIGVAFNAFNSMIVSPTNYLSRYIVRQTSPTVEYDTGGESDELPLMAEHTGSDPIVGAGSGHMIPIRDHGGKLGWTYWALRRGKPEQLRRSIRRLIERAENTWEKRLLTRLFSSTAETVGGTGKSVPFADGGVADPNFVPRNYGGAAFDATHTHFLRKSDDAAGRASFAADGAAHLRHHGINGPYDLIIPEADAAAWAALTWAGTSNVANFVKPERGIITLRNIEQRAEIDEEIYMGVLEVNRSYFYVKPTPRLASDYAGIFRPLGLDSPDNPLAIRYEQGYPLGLAMVAKVDHFPFEEAQGVFTFGAGVNKREAGVLCKFASSGNYSDPAIS